MYRNMRDTVLSQEFGGLKAFSMFALSDFVTLVDKHNREIIFNINNNLHVFVFSVFHLELNIGKSNNRFSFFDKLFITNIDTSEFKWKRVSNHKIKKIVKTYSVIEPRNLYIDIDNGKSCFSMFNGAGIEPVNCFSLIK